MHTVLPPLLQGRREKNSGLRAPISGGSI